MKEEDLIKKLESTQPPEVELPSHKNQLKMALLEERHTTNVAELVKTKIGGGLDIIRNMLMSKQPVWRTALISVIAIALVVGLPITLPLLAEQSDTANAKEIVLNNIDEVILEALGGEEISELHVVHNRDNMATVLLAGDSPIFKVMVDVDLSAREIIEVYILPSVELLQPTESRMTDEEKDKILKILNTNPDIKALFDKGAVLAPEIITTSVSVGVIDDETGLTAAEGVSDKEAKIWIILGDKRYFAHIDLIREEILWFGDTENPEYEEKYSQEAQRSSFP
jgi:hypothetical protein